MILYFIFGLLGLIGIVTVIGGAAQEHDVLVSAGLATLAISSLILGMLLGMEATRTSKQPIKPSIKIECVDGKCDTMYIYEFKLEE
jgi:hypothetical protein